MRDQRSEILYEAASALLHGGLDVIEAGDQWTGCQLLRAARVLLEAVQMLDGPPAEPTPA